MKQVFRVVAVCREIGAENILSSTVLLQHLKGASHVGPRTCLDVSVIEDEPDEFKVGDRVKTYSSAPSRTIEELVQHYKVRYPDGSFAILPRERLTKLPPEPTHTVDRCGDSLRLIRDLGRGEWDVYDSVSMSNPEAVSRQIDLWSEHQHIDADEARKLIAVPTVLATRTLGPVIQCTAIRFATGWLVRVGEIQVGGNWTAAESGAIVSQAEAKMLFPGILGPCLTKVP